MKGGEIRAKGGENRAKGGENRVKGGENRANGGFILIYKPTFPRFSLFMSKLELQKPRNSIEISNTITATQRKAFNCLMLQSILTPKPRGQKYHTISIKELCHLTGYRQKDLLYLDKQLEEMQTTLIRWSGADGKKWGRVQFLGHVEYDENTGILEYSFSEKLSDMVKENKLFNQLDVGSMRELTSKHSLALYEMCAGYRETETYKNGTGWWHLDDVKHLLCGDSKAYPQFKDFNRDVLKPAIKEVNEHTDITIEMETQKQMRRIAALRFNVKSKLDHSACALEKPKSINTPKFGENIDAKQKASEEEFESPEDMVAFFKNLK